MRKGFLVGVIVVVLVTVALAGHWQSLPTAAGPVVRPAESSRELPVVKQAESVPDLEQAVLKFIEVIRGGPTSDLLEYWPDDGVAFGIDTEPISKKEARKQMEQRRGVYCFFFDTACLRNEATASRRQAGRPGSVKGIFCYRDLLKMGRQAKPKVVQHREQGSLMGNVLIRLEDGEAFKQNQLEFEFVFERGNWKLASVIYN